ncbi:MAG: hypothetical protein KF686_03305 [Ramlibacter sp.]|nr:hypothetical protein [Ramlibacter sp.]
MRVLYVLLVAVLASGCAAKVLSVSERSVVVQARIQDVAEAQSLANAECAKSGRKARLAGKLTANQFSFDCEN